MYLKKVYINKAAQEIMNEHAHSGSPQEVGGFLLGRPFNEVGEHVAWVLDAIQGDCESYRSRVLIKSSTYDRVWNKVEENDLVVIGWYHTHPGFGIFLSTTDINTMGLYYNQMYHVAIVLDPVNEKCGVFGWMSPFDSHSLNKIPTYVFIGPDYKNYSLKYTNSISLNI